jgi:hypothetical protein
LEHFRFLNGPVRKFTKPYRNIPIGRFPFLFVVFVIVYRGGERGEVERGIGGGGRGGGGGGSYRRGGGEGGGEGGGMGRLML